MLELGDDDSGDHHGNPHHDRSGVQHGFASHLIDNSHGRKGRNEENNASNSGGKQGLSSAGQTESLEDLAGIVDDGVDTAVFPLASGLLPLRQLALTSTAART